MSQSLQIDSTIVFYMLSRTIANLRLANSQHFNFSFYTEKHLSLMREFSSKLKEINSKFKNMQDANSVSYMTQQISELSYKFKKQIEGLDAKSKEDYVKNYMTAHMDQQIQTNKQQTKNIIPNKLIVKKLHFNKKQILLTGVQHGNQQHSFYIKRLMENLKIDSVVTYIEPDMPYFIKTQTSFLRQWITFLNDTDAAPKTKFYINPFPRSIPQISIHFNQIKLVKQSLQKSSQFYVMMHTILKYDKISNEYLPTPLLTPLITNDVKNLYFCGYPVVKQRQQQAKLIPLDFLKQVYQIYLEDQKKKESNFDASIVFPEIIKKQKFAHICNITRVASQRSNLRTALILPTDLIQLLCEQWQKPNPGQQMSNYFDFGQTPWPQITFIEFVEKLVLLDLMTGNYIDDFYIRYNSFPYNCMKTVGGKQHLGKIFMVWKFYHDKYRQPLVKSRQIQRLKKMQFSGTSASK